MCSDRTNIKRTSFVNRRATAARRGRGRRPQEIDDGHAGKNRGERTTRGEHGVGHRGHHRKLVEAQLRAGPIPLHPAPHYQAERASKTVPGPAAGKSLFRCAEKLQAGGGALVRVVRQLSRLRPHHLLAPASFGQIQFHLHVENRAEEKEENSKELKKNKRIFPLLFDIHFLAMSDE